MKKTRSQKSRDTVPLNYNVDWKRFFCCFYNKGGVKTKNFPKKYANLLSLISDIPAGDEKIGNLFL